MKIIVNNGTVTVLSDDEITILDHIPAGCYNVSFDKMRGPFLSKRENLCVNEKVYGNHAEKVTKTFNAFHASSRSLGVILSGKKGIGKTLFVNILAEEAIKNGFPVLIVNSNQPNLTGFLSSITQECVVIFDEFEKNFKDDNDDEDDNYSSDQAGLLSMFDGLDNTKKLYLITCNNISGLNPFIINRPGRFHYHFKLKNPVPDEVREYLTDNLNPQYFDVIDRIVSFSLITEVTYDWLRAICFEINCGSSLEEAIEDLNIEAATYCCYYVTAFVRGEECCGSFRTVLGANSITETVILYSSSSGKSYYLMFKNDDLQLKNGQLVLADDRFNITVRRESATVDVDNVTNEDVTNIKIELNVDTDKKKLLF